MEKMITLEISQEEASQFSAELARLAAQVERDEVESLERDARFWRSSAEFDERMACTRQSLDNVEKYQAASIRYWREEAHRQSLEIERLRQEHRRLLEQKERASLPLASRAKKPKKT